MSEQKTKGPFRQWISENSVGVRLIFSFLFVVLCTAFIVIISVKWSADKEIEEKFSDESIRASLQMTSRIVDYRQARMRIPKKETTRLADLKETEVFSQRQREITRDILDSTKHRILFLLLPLFLFFGWGALMAAVKLGEPLNRFKGVFRELQKLNLQKRVELSKYHEGQRTAKSLNSALDEMDQTIARMKKATRDLQDSEAYRDAISKELDRFKVSQDA